MGDNSLDKRRDDFRIANADRRKWVSLKLRLMRLRRLTVPKTEIDEIEEEEEEVNTQVVEMNDDEISNYSYGYPFTKMIRSDELGVHKTEIEEEVNTQVEGVPNKTEIEMEEVNTQVVDMKIAEWRDYFRIAKTDIFNIIEHAIVVAASDSPYDFKSKRHRIAEMLGVPKTEIEEEKEKEEEVNAQVVSEGVPNKTEIDEIEKEEKINAQVAYLTRKYSRYGYPVPYEFHQEVSKIKRILDNYEQEPDAKLFDSLMRLELVTVTKCALKV